MKPANFLVLAVTLIVTLALSNLTLATPVILVTNISYADFAVGSVAGAKIGAPVFVIEKNEIPEEVMQEIENLTPEEIYIIGGPAVISEVVENNLEENYNVTRIWGMTRFGTSAEVAKFFWQEGSEKAVLAFDLPDGPVTDENYVDAVIQAKEYAIEEGIPLLLIPQNGIPLVVKEALEELNVKEVVMIGNGSEETLIDIQNLSLQVKEWKKNWREVRKEIFEKLKNKFKETPLIVAAKRWEDRLSAPYSPGNSTIFIISNESQIPELIEDLKEINASKVRLVGNPELASKIKESLENEGFEVVHKPLPYLKVQVEIWKENKKKILEKRKRFLEKIKKKIKEKLEKNKDKLKERCERIYERAKEMLESINKTEYLDRLEELKEKCLKEAEEHPLKVALILERIKHLGRKNIYKAWKVRNSETGNEVIDLELRKARVISSSLKNRLKIIEKQIVNKQTCIALKERVKKLVSQGKYIQAKVLLGKLMEDCGKKEIKSCRRKVRECLSLRYKCVLAKRICENLKKRCNTLKEKGIETAKECKYLKRKCENAEKICKEHKEKCEVVYEKCKGYLTNLQSNIKVKNKQQNLTEVKPKKKFYKCPVFAKKQVCTQEYLPVCAKIKKFVPGKGFVVEWKTFSNPCLACTSSTKGAIVLGYLKGTCEENNL